MAAQRGRPPKNKTNTKASNSDKIVLICNCGNSDPNDFYKSNSIFNDGIGNIPYCKNCIDKLYKHYLKIYQNENCEFPEKKAIRRLCMAFDLYWCDKAFDTALKQLERMPTMSMMTSYIKAVRLNQYLNKTYDDTLKTENGVVIVNNTQSNGYSDREKATKIFGSGFSAEDYKFLLEQYDDWTARHECQTKSQEEIFKRICFKQLEILKASRQGEDTKDLDASLLKILEAAKLQPKQSSGETTSEVQTFGTLIDKWENTRPLPEVDEELIDVDKIAMYLEVFFKGHLAKMMGLKNGVSRSYEKYMKKYTVERPEYNDDENGEALFDAIFGNANIDDI